MNVSVHIEMHPHPSSLQKLNVNLDSSFSESPHIQLFNVLLTVLNTD